LTSLRVETVFWFSASAPRPCFYLRLVFLVASSRLILDLHPDRFVPIHVAPEVRPGFRRVRPEKNLSPSTLPRSAELNTPGREITAATCRTARFFRTVMPRPRWTLRRRGDNDRGAMAWNVHCRSAAGQGRPSNNESKVKKRPRKSCKIGQRSALKRPWQGSIGDKARPPALGCENVPSPPAPPPLKTTTTTNFSRDTRPPGGGTVRANWLG
jgi:hypothetical protein